MNVWENASARDRYVSEQFVELLVIADSELHVARNNARPLVVAGSVPSELKDLGGKVLKDGGEVHGRTTTNAGGIATLPEEPGNTTDGELEAGPCTTGGGLAHLPLSLSSAI